MLFLSNYIISVSCLYSDLDPENSGHILDALHDLLKEISERVIYNKGGGPDPEFKNFKYLFIDNGDKSDRWKCDSKSLELLDDPSLEIMSNKLDIHNEKYMPLPHEMLKEKNTCIAKNSTIYYNNPYGVSEIGIKDFQQYFWRLEHIIAQNIKDYNTLKGCRFYYEADNKNEIPQFKSMWDNYYRTQIADSNELARYKAILESQEARYNFLSKKYIYGECLDNGLIIGTNILCLDYIYKHLHATYIDNFIDNDYQPNDKLTLLEFYSKACKLSLEAKDIYYPFLHHYNWHNKLFQLNHNSS